MLLRTMFFIAFLALISATIVNGAAAMARAELHVRALAAARSASASATAEAQSAIASALAEGKIASSVTFPSPVPQCVIPQTQPCAMVAASSIALAASPAPAASACPGTDCAVYLQGNRSIAEDRVAVSISTTVADAAGRVLARHASIQSFRVFGTPPYVTADGAADASIDGIVNNAVGDDGGSSGSLVSVQYENASSGARISGNIWRPKLEDPVSSSPAWDR